MTLTEMSKLQSVATATVIASMMLGLCALSTAQRRQIAAPTYYIAAEVKECNSNHISVRGATDLPPGAVLAVSVGMGLGKGYGQLKHFSNVSNTIVDENGQFTAQLQASPGRHFQSNRLVAYVVFQPEVTKQPKSVVNVVGRKGEKLDILNNPQAFQTSGSWYGVEEVALVGECFNF